MRKIKWSAARAKQQANMRQLSRLPDWKRLPRTRPRDPEETEILIQITLNRFRRWLETGKMEIISPRKLRYRVDYKTKR